MSDVPGDQKAGSRRFRTLQKPVIGFIGGNGNDVSGLDEGASSADPGEGVVHPPGIKRQLLTVQDPGIFSKDWPREAQVKLLADSQIQDRRLKAVLPDEG
jgi:hypothetical protein